MTEPRKVVLAPDLLLRALFDPRARNVLNQWRDGLIVPVVTRELLVLYLKKLRQVGLGPELVRKWSLWLTSAEKAIYLDGLSVQQSGGLSLCREVAAATGAALIPGESSSNVRTAEF